MRQKEKKRENAQLAKRIQYNIHEGCTECSLEYALMMEGCKRCMLSRPCPASGNGAVIAQVALKNSSLGRTSCMHVLALADCQ